MNSRPINSKWDFIEIRAVTSLRYKITPRWRSGSSSNYNSQKILVVIIRTKSLIIQSVTEFLSYIYIYIYIYIEFTKAIFRYLSHLINCTVTHATTLKVLTEGYHILSHSFLSFNRIRRRNYARRYVCT